MWPMTTPLSSVVEAAGTSRLPGGKTFNEPALIAIFCNSGQPTFSSFENKRFDFSGRDGGLLRCQTANPQGGSNSG